MSYPYRQQYNDTVRWDVHFLSSPFSLKVLGQNIWIYASLPLTHSLSLSLSLTLTFSHSTHRLYSLCSIYLSPPFPLYLFFYFYSLLALLYNVISFGKVLGKNSCMHLFHPFHSLYLCKGRRKSQHRADKLFIRLYMVKGRHLEN